MVAIKCCCCEWEVGRREIFNIVKILTLLLIVVAIAAGELYTKKNINSQNTYFIFIQIYFTKIFFVSNLFTATTLGIIIYTARRITKDDINAIWLSPVNASKDLP